MIIGPTEPNLISWIGFLNKACNKANVSWQILKYPGEYKYTALVTPKDGDKGAATVEAEHIDDLIERIVNEAHTYIS